MAKEFIVCFALCVVLARSLDVDPGTPFTRRPVIVAPLALRDAKEPVPATIQQRLDHVDSGETRTWQQRYFINEQFYEIGGPIFVMMSIEGAANPDFLRGGQMMELALLYKAKTFLLEERFYGQSIPTPDTSIESLQYASPEQNVGDLATFISAIKISHPGSKVIAFGGSFGGSNVAWTKQQYPDLIDGAVVSSSPLLAVFGFDEYFEEVARVMALSSEQCVTDMKNATATLEDILYGSETGGATVADLFDLCVPLDATNPMDVSNFFLLFANIYASIVQATNSLTAVDSYCNLITNPLFGSTPVDRLVQLVITIYRPTQCLEMRYEPLLPYFTNTSWDSPVVERRNYLYTTCAFYGDFQTSASPDQPFGSSFPVGIFEQICADYYSPSYDATFIQSAVDATNARFGGLTPDVTNTVFVQGSLDPWRVLGVVTDLSETATAIVIDGTSHITDMNTSNAVDSDNLKEARAKIRELVGLWIS